MTRPGRPLTSTWTDAWEWGARLVAGARWWRASTPRPQPTAMGEYLPLYHYLRDRHANRVVLTFAEIESLVGFRLPAAARAEPGWWSGPNAVAGEAWGLADRSVVANLVAEMVVCERHSPLAGGTT